MANAAWAVHRVGNVELDGNTANDGAAVPGEDDWDDIYLNTSHALRSAFVLDSAARDPTTFSGGVKDTEPLTDWTCVRAGVQDKSNILHAYGATYEVDGDLYFYAGADREGNLGDSNIGVWLFQGPVGCSSTGATVPFFGTHLDGDLLMVAEFDQGGRVESIQVYRWSDPNGIPQSGDECLGGSAGDCSDAGVPAFSGLNCSDSNPGDLVCGRTNPVNAIDAAWRPGIKKQSFLEIGINLSRLVSGAGCFANAIVETRSSTSLNATLKDFVALELSTCGTLTVDKQTTGGNANFGFALDPSIGDTGTFELAGGEARNFGTVEPGDYLLEESAVPAGPAAPYGWRLDEIRCGGGTPGEPSYVQDGHGGGSIPLVVDFQDDVNCTFSNVFTPPPGSVTIEKSCSSVTPDGQIFAFELDGFGGSSTPDCASGSVQLGCGEFISCTGLGAGSYTIAEAAVPDWTLTAVECSGESTACDNTADPQAVLLIAAGGAATARFSNAENASIEVCKVTSPTDSGGSFDFSGGLGEFSLADGECYGPQPVAPGFEHEIIEAVTTGYRLDQINCSGASWVAEGTRLTVSPQAGEAVRCDFTNVERPGSIRICSQTVTTSGDDPSFGYELTGPAPDLPAAVALTGGFCDLGPGDPNPLSLPAANGYAVSHAPLDGWDTTVSCLGSGGAENPESISLSADEAVVCTFTHTQRGRIIVEKQTDPAGAALSFEFAGDIEGIMSDDGQLEKEVIHGSYAVTELPQPGWSLLAIVCDDDDSSGSGTTALFSVDPGESVRCVFLNREDRGQIAVFQVNKVFSDGDNPTAVRVRLTCTSGLPLIQDFWITESSGVQFVVDNFVSGQMDCEISEDTSGLPGYTPTYAPIGTGTAATDEGCRIEGVEAGAGYGCTVINDPNPVDVSIDKRWFGEEALDTSGRRYVLTLYCDAPIVGGQQPCTVFSGGDGLPPPVGVSCRQFRGQSSEKFVAQVIPQWGGSHCWVDELVYDDAVEVDNGCDSIPVTGGTNVTCTVTNTVFFEGIPALDRRGMVLLVALLLMASVPAYRRLAH